MTSRTATIAPAALIARFDLRDIRALGGAENLHAYVKALTVRVGT